MHSSMDKNSSQPRPHCSTHGKTFRTWKAAYKHKHKNEDCNLVTKIITTR